MRTNRSEVDTERNACPMRPALTGGAAFRVDGARSITMGRVGRRDARREREKSEELLPRPDGNINRSTKQESDIQNGRSEGIPKRRCGARPRPWPLYAYIYSMHAALKGRVRKSVFAAEERGHFTISGGNELGVA